MNWFRTLPLVALAGSLACLPPAPVDDPGAPAATEDVLPEPEAGLRSRRARAS